jgi:hypothetical protein
MSLFIRPSLKLIKTTIQKTVGFRVAWFDMQINLLQNEIKFVLPFENTKRVYPYEDKNNLVGIIKSMVQKELKTGDTIDIIIIKYTETSPKVDVYYTSEKNEKLSKSIQL